jgi:predicted membrane-bound spermidine synthase
LQRIPVIWRANIIAFISSFCVMVLELIAARMLAPYIGVSLYTWTSIIGVILAGIALGNYLGGRLADRYASPGILAIIFFVGAFTTMAVLPAAKVFGTADWFRHLPVMLEFVTKVFCIFFLPAIVLSMVSPTVIKLTLADLGRTGGIVGTIYAVSTVGSIAGTFLTGFYFILWFGTRSIVWLIAVALVLTGVLAWFAWRVPERWHFSRKNLFTWILALVVVVSGIILYRLPGTWQETYTAESNYYCIRVADGWGMRVLYLDRLVHSFIVPDDPTSLQYSYLRMFANIIEDLSENDPAPVVLHLGGGGYCLPRYMEVVYPESTNDVVEIDPAVTEVAYTELGLPRDTSIRTLNLDARQYLMRREDSVKYDIIVGDVFNDLSTPYHLTTLEFDRLVKDGLTADGVYLLNIIDDYNSGRYISSFVYTLQRVFRYVYLFPEMYGPEEAIGRTTFVIAAGDQPLERRQFSASVPLSEDELKAFLEKRPSILLTDDYVPTDILVAPLVDEIR